MFRVLLNTGKVDLNNALQSLMNSPHIRLQDRGGQWGEVLEMLLEAGADPSQLGDGGITIVHLVAGYGTPAMLELLLKYGADIHFHKNYVTTPLMRAAHRHHGNNSLEMLRALLKYNCDMLATTRAFHTKTTNSAFSIAYSYSRFDSIKCLIEAGYKITDDTIKQSFLTGSSKKVFSGSKRRPYIDITPGEEFVEWFRGYRGNARSLKHCCRLRIREILGSSFQRNMCHDNLLPPSIKRYLYLDDLWIEQ